MEEGIKTRQTCPSAADKFGKFAAKRRMQCSTTGPPSDAEFEALLVANGLPDGGLALVSQAVVLHVELCKAKALFRGTYNKGSRGMGKAARTSVREVRTRMSEAIRMESIGLRSQ